MDVQGGLAPRADRLRLPLPILLKGERLLEQGSVYRPNTSTRLDEIKNFHHYLQSGTVSNHRASPAAKPAWKRAASYSRSGWSSAEAPDVSEGTSGLWRAAARPECGKAACASSRARDGHGHAISGSCPLAPGIR